MRAYGGFEGIAVVAVLLSCAFWVGLALDWTFEPPWEFRLVALLALLVAALLVGYRLILRRVFVRLRDPSMAVLLERHYDHFRDSLVTSVEMAGQPTRASEFNPSMLQHTQSEAVEKAARLRVTRLFDTVPLLRSVCAAGILAASIALFGLTSRDAFGTWLQRIQLSEAPWPRNTELIVAGFTEDPADGLRRVKMGRAGDLNLEVRARHKDGQPPPRTVDLRYRFSDGSRGEPR